MSIPGGRIGQTPFVWDISIYPIWVHVSACRRQPMSAQSFCSVRRSDCLFIFGSRVPDICKMLRIEFLFLLALGYSLGLSWSQIGSWQCCFVSLLFGKLRIVLRSLHLPRRAFPRSAHWNLNLTVVQIMVFAKLRHRDVKNALRDLHLMKWDNWRKSH